MSRPNFDLFLVLCPVREIVAEARILLAPLTHLHASYLDSLEAYYNEDGDAGLIRLCFSVLVRDPEIQRKLALQIGELGLPIVVPQAMSPADRDHFYGEHLPRYDYYFQQYATTGDQAVVLRVLETLEEQARSSLPPVSRRPRSAKTRPSSEWTLV